MGRRTPADARPACTRPPACLPARRAADEHAPQAVVSLPHCTTTKAMDALAAEAKARRAEQVRKDVELARVKVNPDDVKLIVSVD